MIVKRLTGTAPLPTPEAATALYAARPELAQACKPETVEWDPELRRDVVREYVGLRSQWIFDYAADRNWGQQETRDGQPTGNCNDFAPALMLALMGQGIPRAALRLVVCRVPDPTRKSSDSIGHMVLSLETSAGSLICCSLQGCWMLADAYKWRGHDWLHMEAHPGWVSLRTATLADML